MPLDSETYAGAVRREGLLVADAAARAGLGTVVPSCPDWTVADLVWHVGEVLDFWASLVADGTTDPTEYVAPPRPAEADLLAWYRSGVDRAVAVLRSAPPDRVVWSWAPGGGSAAWVTRRMAHETAVHRVDAESAAGAVTPIDPVLAVDGVDEFLEQFTARPAPDAAPLAGTVHLHATDTDADLAGEWFVVETDPAGPLAWRREHAKGDVAVRGTASDLLLALWRRVPLDERFALFGDAAVAQRLLHRTDLD